VEVVMFKFEMPGFRFEEKATRYVISLVRYEGPLVGQKIQQTKEIRNITGWRLATAKDWQEGMIHAEHVASMDTIRELQRAGFTVARNRVVS
jgi:ribosomal protein L7/L12